MESEHPSFAFLMITYNQEKYVLQALESAVAQDYPNLEIIVCDDVSKDRTYELARAFAAKYTGPHRLKVFRNERNLGISGNFWHAARLTAAEWLFMAAGDDVSLPDRAQRVAAAVRAHPSARLVTGNFRIIDGDSRPVGIYKPHLPHALGAVAAWHRSVMADFPPVSSEQRVEDMALLFRVFLGGHEMVKLRDVLADYRVDGHNYAGGASDTTAGRLATDRKINLTRKLYNQQRLADLDFALAAGYPVARPDEYRRRFEAELAAAESAMARDERLLGYLDGGLLGCMRFLACASDVPLRQRLKMAMAQSGRLVALKRRMLHHGQTVPDVFVAGCVPELPPDAETMVITQEMLFSPPCDHLFGN